MEKILLSIIVPIYNVQNYLRRCIESVLSQNLNECEVILVDDGSTDLSGNICDMYEDQFDCIKVIHQKNEGLSGARNKGIERASGEYIMFLDSDDWIEKESIEKFKRVIINNNPDLITGKSWVVSEEGIKRPKLPYYLVEGLYTVYGFQKALEKKSAFSVCAPYYIFKREIVMYKKLRFKMGILNEDDLWTPTLLLESTNIYYVDFFFYNHFIRNNSIMHGTESDTLARNYFIVCKDLEELFELNNRYSSIMKNHLASIFLQAVCLSSDYKRYIKKFDRRMPIKNAFFFKMKAKAFLYLLSPKLYRCVHKIIKGF